MLLTTSKRTRQSRKRSFLTTIKPSSSLPTSRKRNQLIAVARSREDSLPKRLKQAEAEQDEEGDAELNRYLAMSVTSLALAGAGGIVVSVPLVLASVPLLIVGLKPLWQHTYESLAKQENVSAVLIDAISVGGSLISGNIFATALANTTSNAARKLLLLTEDSSRKSLTNVFGERPKTVWVQTDGNNGDPVEIKIPFEELSIGDIVIVDAGQAMPIDGTIYEGTGSVDQRALTGESQPVEKSVGDSVLAATVLLSGRLLVRVDKAGEETIAAQISTILNANDDFKSSIQSRGQRIVNQGAKPTLILSALTLPALGVQSALAILFASVGYHMKLAAPISVLNFLRITSDKGILVKDGRSLELLSQIDTVVFDKTGTLTEDVPTVGRLLTQDSVTEEALLRLAAAAEQKQPHPIAQAIVKAAKAQGVTLAGIDSAEYELGYGLKVKLTTGETIRIGSSRFLKMCDIVIPDHYDGLADESAAQGGSLVYVAQADRLLGAIELLPTVRPEAHATVAELHRRNIRTVIISGDHRKPTETLADELGIDHVFAEVLPQDKAKIVEKLQDEGRSVCFIGDGINDSIALKTAHVGISMSGASTAATDTAGVILMDGTLKRMIELFSIADDLDSNITRSMQITVIPGVVCMGGVLFFHVGLISSIMVYNLVMIGSIGNALIPLVKHLRASDEPSSMPSHQISNHVVTTAE